MDPSAGAQGAMSAGPRADAALPELDLLDYRRRVAGLYATVRAERDPGRAFAHWKAERDDLFAHHPQSALQPGRRPGFTGLSYFPHDPDARVLATVEPAERRRFEVPSSDGATMALERIGVGRFVLGGADLALELYWLLGYGGGLFVPFADATSGHETYGAGRYLLDTIKGADLGAAPDGRLVLDFNLAYNPSCSYDPRWTCPLAPPPNRLPVRVEAGERHLDG
jgi:uncharacterized protein (DUF1684 family)